MKNIIWSNEINLEDWQDFISENWPDEDLTEAEQYQAVQTELEMQYDEERANLNVTLPGPVMVIADLGLWNGRRIAYKFIGSNLRDCLSVHEGDYVTYYVDELGDLCCDDTHHDGTNHYLFRMLKPDKSIGPLGRKFMRGTVTRRDITNYTSSVGIYAADVYGWKVRGRKAI